MNVSKIKDFCKSCLDDANELEIHQSLNGNSLAYVECEQTFLSNCQLLFTMLGDQAEAYKHTLGKAISSNLSIIELIGSLKSLLNAIEKGYLGKIENFIFAEAFSSLIEQAEYLYKEGYKLAAGVIARAVLEEKLRNLCAANGATFTKARPTLGNYNTELYKIKLYDKTQMKHIDFLISVGNDAAHNNKSFNPDDVKKMIEGVNEILRKY